MADIGKRFRSMGGKRLVLIAEDEYINREILRSILEDDYQLLFAENGREALDLLKKNKDALSVVLLDLMMPVMSGMEVLQLAKADPELAQIPIIVLTSDQEAEVESLTLGANDFISKPYPRARVVQARVLRTIELSEDRQIISSTERDALTGLYTRDYFYRYAEQFDRHFPHVSTDAVVVDINRFHMLNERFGMAYGDKVLKGVGDALSASVDEVGGIVCRREADTFLVYCPNGMDYNALLDTASAALDVGGGDTGYVRLRMGVYADVDKSVGIEQRFDRAKVASDTVQGSFTKRIGIYDSALHDKERFSEQLIADFNRAIEEHQFQVYYQPKFDVRYEMPLLQSAEALVRWRHPELGMISPGDFIPLFEGNGLIQSLDSYVWREAAAQIRKWRDCLGYAVPVSVNVSRIDIYDPNLIETLQSILAENGLTTNDLLLEITESAYTQDSDRIIDTVNDLRSLGFKIEMDDFGTGYSSLNMISMLPIDILKLDMQFIRNSFNQRRDTRIVEIIIEIADYLAVPVIAEGVETEEQMRALRAMGCDYVQGYYFSRPVPAAEFEKFLIVRKQHAEEGADIAARRVRACAGPVSASLRTSQTSSGEGGTSDDAGTEFERAVRALATDYFSIYYIDTVNDRFIEYGPPSYSGEQGSEIEGRDFFSWFRRDVLETVYPEDVEMVLASFTKGNVLAAIAQDRAFTLTYRMMRDAKPTYVHLKATRMGGRVDTGSIVIGISDVDEQIRREHEYSQTMRKASVDTLTGVKSKFAYLEEERKIDHAIRQGKQEPFTIAVCDVVGLRRINDTMGTTVGDRYIKDACAIICNTFKRSPVYRVGGGTFAVILGGKDHEDRVSLMESIGQSNDDNKRSEGVLIAWGGASYEQGKDAVLSAVYERADIEMRKKKTQLHEEL